MKAKLQKLWNTKSYYETAKEASSDSTHPGMILLKKLAKNADTILDIGCGEGTRLALIANATKKKLVGVDTSIKAISLAKKKYKKINFIKTNGHTLPFKDNQFALVFSAFVLEHTDNPENFITEAARVAAKGGRLVFLAPNYGAPARCSPCFIDSRLKKLVSGFLKDITRPFSRINSLSWNKVTPIATPKKYEIDYDTTVEPYIGTLIPFLKSNGFKIIKADTLWALELPGAKPHQKIFRLLSFLKIYPFTHWGPQILLYAMKNEK